MSASCINRHNYFWRCRMKPSRIWMENQNEKGNLEIDPNSFKKCVNIICIILKSETPWPGRPAWVVRLGRNLAKYVKKRGSSWFLKACFVGLTGSRTFSPSFKSTQIPSIKVVVSLMASFFRLKSRFLEYYKPPILPSDVVLPLNTYYEIALFSPSI